jgi:hypothetical protein
MALRLPEGSDKLSLILFVLSEAISFVLFRSPTGVALLIIRGINFERRTRVDPSRWRRRSAILLGGRGF